METPPLQPVDAFHAALVMRQTADLLRDLARDTNQGTWTYADNEEHWQLFGGMYQLIKARKRDREYQPYWPTEADGRWIAVASPELVDPLVLVLEQAYGFINLALAVHRASQVTLSPLELAVYHLARTIVRRVNEVEYP